MKTAMVFGQMNEPPGAECVLLYWFDNCGIFRDVEGQDVFSSSIISSVSLKQVLRFLPFLVMPSASWFTNLQLATEMGQLQERITSTKKVLLHQSKPSTFQPMTILTQRQLQHLLTWIQQPTLNVS